MKNITEKIDKYLNEAKTMKVDEFVNKLDSTIRKHFPKSYINVRTHSGLGKSIDVIFTLGKDKSQWSNGIIENDPLFHRFTMGYDSFNDNEFIKDKIESELITGGSLSTLPPQNSYLAFGRVKIGWRNKTAVPEAIIKHFDNYFVKVKKVLKDNIENITNKDKELNKDKL